MRQLPLKELITYTSQEKKAIPYHKGPQSESPGLVREQEQREILGVYCCGSGNWLGEDIPY